MKIRNGFVSNSSTSSFVVEYRNPWNKDQTPYISEEQVKLLVEYGFTQTFAQPHHITSNSEVQHDNEGDCYGYYVICNEDQVIDFLISNKIPFTGLTHYEHYAIIYDGERQYRIPNQGNIALMYRQTNNLEQYLVKENE